MLKWGLVTGTFSVCCFGISKYQKADEGNGEVMYVDITDVYLTFFFVVTVADYADADPAVVKSGRVKKAVANAVEKEGNLWWWNLQSDIFVMLNRLDCIVTWRCLEKWSKCSV